MAAVLGQNALVSWGISPPILHFSAGLVLLLVALKAVLAQYETPPPPPAPSAHRNLALSPLAFPTILAPHGIAIFILLLAVTRDPYLDAAIIALFALVMVMNWIVMWFARPIVRRGAIALALLGAVFGVLQVALAVKMMFEALRTMHILPDV